MPRAWDRRFTLAILVEESLKPREMTQGAAARRLGMSTVRLNEIVRGKRGVTADTALRLAQLVKTRHSSGCTCRPFDSPDAP